MFSKERNVLTVRISEFASEKQNTDDGGVRAEVTTKKARRHVRVQDGNQLKSLSRRTAETEEHRDAAESVRRREQEQQRRIEEQRRVN